MDEYGYPTLFDIIVIAGGALLMGVMKDKFEAACPELKDDTPPAVEAPIIITGNVPKYEE
jgi:hypothetical protein